MSGRSPEKKKLDKIFGHIGNERGQITEERVDTAVSEHKNTGSFTKWLLSSRRATKQEDFNLHIDQVFETDIGPLPLQIKAGEASARHFRKIHPEIPAIRIKFYDPNEIVFQQCLSVIGTRRRQLIKERRRVARNLPKQ